jgi:hypothetical protein
MSDDCDGKDGFEIWKVASCSGLLQISYSERNFNNFETKQNKNVTTNGIQ